MSYTLPTSDTRAHVREDFDPSVADRAILELFSLPRCEETIELTRQSVALPSQPSVIGAHSLAEFTQRLPPPSKSRIAYHDIPREADRPPLRWVQVEAPSQPVLEWLGASFSIKRSDILSSLLPDRPAQSYRYGDYLVNSYAELSFNESNPLKIVESRILAILAEDFLITISPKESTSCRRVTEELFEEKDSKIN